ncbi:hypothetical protein CHN50_19680 [Priestia aryabhattai]|jgi:hypothetical protein|uniref:hypothetical protein n=1 Tax=Priestia TaxID=2800373 RepID=UPI000BA08682|nr:hypothetical protein [Priestia flexa]MBY6024538.1 hypothetical protein [Nitratireductor sp. DP7N14-4]MDT2048632.1 hypothetical protein [Priestia flexa]OZT10834.1 hypothetical protein CHN50_19680 [Priestia aryabhattai]USY55320.1 hypothetical protein NIZ91_00995 [Bacillus sp. 1780r2a1]
MKIFAWFLILFHIAVALFWIGNSSYLFSKSGLFCWVFSIVVGYLMYKKQKQKNFTRKILLSSSTFMVFLIIFTGLIEVAVSSMS